MGGPVSRVAGRGTAEPEEGVGARLEPMAASDRMWSVSLVAVSLSTLTIVFLYPSDRAGRTPGP